MRVFGIGLGCWQLGGDFGPMSPAQMAMRWILDYPAVSTVITGAGRPEQVAENARVRELAPLSVELHEKLADFYRREVEEFIVVPI